MEERRRKWKEARSLEQEAGADPSPIENPTTRSGYSFEGELRILRERLLPMVGVDVDLLLEVLVLGEDQREAGRLMGLSHEVTRKRIQRAIRRVRSNLCEQVSQSVGETRVSGGKAVKRPKGAD
jgi:DNA-directed RNA polymerase specialized sigma24 family protein